MKTLMKKIHFNFSIMITFGVNKKKRSRLQWLQNVLIYLKSCFFFPITQKQMEAKSFKCSYLLKLGAGIWISINYVCTFLFECMKFQNKQNACTCNSLLEQFCHLNYKDLSLHFLLVIPIYKM